MSVLSWILSPFRRKLCTKPLLNLERERENNNKCLKKSIGMCVWKCVSCFGRKRSYRTFLWHSDSCFCYNFIEITDSVVVDHPEVKTKVFRYRKPLLHHSTSFLVLHFMLHEQYCHIAIVTDNRNISYFMIEFDWHSNPHLLVNKRFWCQTILILSFTNMVKRLTRHRKKTESWWLLILLAFHFT